MTGHYKRRLAHHEAGHAVVGHVLGGTPSVVTIGAGRHWAGITTWDARGLLGVSEDEVARIGDPHPLLPANLRRKIEVAVIVSLAGEAAEWLSWDEPADRPARMPAPIAHRVAAPPSQAERRTLVEADRPIESDGESAWANAKALMGSMELACAFLHFQRAVTRDLVRSHASTIRAVADELMTHETLCGRAVCEVIDAATVEGVA